MTIYVFREGRFVHKATGEPMPMPERNEICMPRVQSDIPEYRSPVGDHKLITSRSERRDDLARHNCVELPPREKPRGYKNPKFMKKHGISPDRHVAA